MYKYICLISIAFDVLEFKVRSRLDGLVRATTTRALHACSLACVGEQLGCCV